MFLQFLESSRPSKTPTRNVKPAKIPFLSNHCREQADKFKESSRKNHEAWYQEGLKKYNQLSKDDKELWEQKAGHHDTKQPSIKKRLLKELKKNPKISWAALEKCLDHWCSTATIWRWVTSFDEYKCYCERFIPLLSESQKKTRLEFAKRFRNNWGLGGGKYVVIMYDEKWFWGLVIRRGAKACSDLGVDQQNFKAYHRNHINKVMAIAFTLFAFADSMDNGGDAEKLALIRAQGYKVADKRVKQSTRDESGRVKYDGPIIREKV
jgi:hypothetical protein